MTADELLKKNFKRSLMGYSTAEVNKIRDLAAERLAALTSENQAMQSQMKELKGELASYREREKSLEATLAQTRELAAEVKTNAEREARVLLAEAELQAEKILNQAHNRLARIHDDISELKRQRAQFEVRLRSLIEAHLKLLEVEGDRDRDLAELEDKIRILRTPNNGKS